MWLVEVGGGTTSSMLSDLEVPKHHKLPSINERRYSCVGWRII